jgi:hypothetical protein
LHRLIGPMTANHGEHIPLQLKGEYICIIVPVGVRKATDSGGVVRL